jgi:type II secretory pathway component HofQ
MNTRRRRVRDAAWVVCAMTLLCAAAGVSAQTIYRQLDADGRVTYTDRPEPTLLTAAAMVPTPDLAAALAGSAALSSRHAAAVDASEAARRLKQAERERQQGAERLPGEQSHGHADADAAKGRYWQRQENLQQVVEQARRRANETARSLREHL